MPERYSRKEFLRRALATTAGVAASQGLFQTKHASAGSQHRTPPDPDSPLKDTRRLVTLSFDDGFRKSSLRTAEIFERFELSACINVIASGHLADQPLPDEYHRWPKGDFGLWRELRDRGHEIMPHGYRHADLSAMPLQEAKDLIQRCLDIFIQELPGFDPSRAVFNFPYNRSTPELETWLGTQVRGFRTGGPAINPLPTPQTVRLTCTSYGPDTIDRHLETQVQELLDLESGWLVYNTHGIDDEGWGPVSSRYLENLLERLTEMDSVAVVPAAAVLNAVT
ncbi:MAG TPA: polysaccharide deacetylase family protein [Acidobacteriota bacterium]|nr:polysaccharide deacetylase family protein [Acidobacteriota bacterium]